MDRSGQQRNPMPVHLGTFRDGTIELDHPADWPDGQRVCVQVAGGCAAFPCDGPAVIAGFGPAGRCVADLLGKRGVPYVIIDRNPKTVPTQEELGRRIVLGDVSDPAVLEQAGIRTAKLLVLTIPDEKSTIRAIRSARLMSRSIVILARTEYFSTALVARRAGANMVISAELAVAKDFHELLGVNLSSAPAMEGQAGS